MVIDLNKWTFNVPRLNRIPIKTAQEHWDLAEISSWNGDFTSPGTGNITLATGCSLPGPLGCIFCHEQNLHHLSKRITLQFQKTQKVAKNSQTGYWGLAYSPNELFESLYWVRQASARRWRVRSCCSVKQDNLNSCWVTALQLIGCSFLLGLFYCLILGFFEFTVTAV